LASATFQAALVYPDVTGTIVEFVYLNGPESTLARCGPLWSEFQTAPRPEADVIVSRIPLCETPQLFEMEFVPESRPSRASNYLGAKCGRAHWLPCKLINLFFNPHYRRRS